MNTSLKRWLAIAILFFVFSCSDDNDPKTSSVLVEATPILVRSASELQLFIGSSGIDIEPSVLQHDVELFRVKYKTTYKNAEVIASGIVVLPNATQALGMVSFQHGTITAHADAPTALPLNDGELILYAALSSAGFIAVMPDYIGFGESKNTFHPYYVEEATATAVIDNLKAARELAQQKGKTFNGKLFLAGYSQGGYATMATHKAIEEKGLEGFNLVASFPAAGGYDVKGMQEYFFSQTTYDQPHYIAYVAMSYKSYYSWTGVLGDFFNEPYATNIPTLFNGINTGSAINAQLTDQVSDLIKTDLLDNIDSDPKYEYLTDAFVENSLLDWVPTIPMHMYHGTADDTVPFQNSIDTHTHFMSTGASGEIVTFTALNGADHGSGVVPYLESFTAKLLTLK